MLSLKHHDCSSCCPPPPVFTPFPLPSFSSTSCYMNVKLSVVAKSCRWWPRAAKPWKFHR